MIKKNNGVSKINIKLLALSLVILLQATTSSFAGLCGSKNSASIAPIVDLRDPREPDVRRDIPPADVLAERDSRARKFGLRPRVPARCK